MQVFLLDQCAGCSEKWRHTDCNRRCQRSLPYAGCTGNALSPTDFSVQRTRQQKTRLQSDLGGQPACPVISLETINSINYRNTEIFLLFGDMAIYTTCKNNTFNGMPLPDIWIRHADRTMQQLTLFNYTDFKERLGSRE